MLRPSLPHYIMTSFEISDETDSKNAIKRITIKIKIVR